jgi:hypothetical protein
MAQKLNGSVSGAKSPVVAETHGALVFDRPGTNFPVMLNFSAIIFTGFVAV